MPRVQDLLRINFLWILAAILTTLTAVVIGFAYRDRRTVIRKAKDEAIQAIEGAGFDLNKPDINNLTFSVSGLI